ncbi:FAST kinase domain-containing protein 2, mitochondrial [Ictalurus punctatus]|uniref:FAST kinase domain-containing protein 2, mitochondrial n=1 Tax=Ictalurus punctatus TaxID=7998 RepID=A0A2D0Q281_ICTPU|nr:FAST kinase domain-containing protein 2, mitochondrial [Ictalurus punctatus]XP_017312414.2 FAST kinase domain-containing protein 2, mitochondrial [Ictalurus punctatus]
MNVFLMRSGEMFRFAAILGRFARLNRNRTAVQIHNSTTPCLVRTGRTLQVAAFHSVRYFCRQGARTLSYDERTESLTLSLRVPDPAASEMEQRSTFYQELQECGSPSDVLDLVDRCGVEHRCISNSLTRMWHTTKKMSEEQRRWELRLMAEHPAFEKLCHSARTNAPRMHCHSLAFTLLGLVKLGVSQSSLVVQTLLRVIQERLNEFENEKALSVLASCLSEMDSSKNADALKQGLKLILEDRIPTIQSVMLLHTTMRLFGKDASPAIKQKLEKQALSMADRFTLLNVQYMLDTLAVIRLNSKPLLDVCRKKLAENVHSISFTRLMAILKSCSDLRYRNLHLFTSMSEYLASTLPMWSNKQVLLILLEFKRLGFRPVALMDAFAERIVQKPDSFTLRDLQGVLKSYSFLNHHLKENQQAFLESVTHCLQSYLPKMSSTDLLKAISCLCVFGHFPQAPLEKLLRKEVLDELLKEESPFSAQQERLLWTLDLCLRLDDPALPPSVSSIPHLHHSPPQRRPIDPVLLVALKNLLGEDAVMDSVVEEGHYFIDFVVTLPPNTDEEQSLRIALLCASPTSFCFGTTHPVGPVALTVRHLKLLGYEPVLVPMQELVSQSAEERTDLLKKLIFAEQEKFKSVQDCEVK